MKDCSGTMEWLRSVCLNKVNGTICGPEALHTNSAWVTICQVRQGINSLISKVASLFFFCILLLGVVYTVSLTEKQRNLERSSVAALLKEHRCTEPRLGTPGGSSQLCPVLAQLQHTAAGVNEPVITAITWAIKADHWSWDQESRPLEAVTCLLGLLSVLARTAM